MMDDIQELLAAEPFRPFVIAVVGLDGEYLVEDPRQIRMPQHGETLHYRSRHHDESILAVRHITAVRLVKEKRPW